ncbi:MAG: IPT/TIG domain-containing protein, partial [Elusimicrobiota bacterium]|nr:IPT/TIG domain-containing protein [Elusimicrobiota bacterium]
MAQTFTTGPGFIELGRLDLYLTYGLGTPVDITVQITEVDSDGKPLINHILGSATIPAFNSPAFPNYDWIAVKFPQSIRVQENTKYAIVLSCPYSQTKNVYVWGYGIDSTNGGYQGGSRVNSFDSGATWQQATWEDFIFKTYSPEVYTTAPGFLTRSYAQSLGYDTGFVSVKYNSVRIVQSTPEGTSTKLLFSDSLDNITFGAFVDGVWKESAWTDDITTLNRKYIRWKAILQTTQTFSTPEIDLIEIDYIPQPEPKINSIYPSSGPINGCQTMKILGENFSSGLNVYIDDAEVISAKLIDTNTIEILTPASHSLGKKDVTVVNPNGQIATLQNGYAYLPLIVEEFNTELYKDSINTNAVWNTSEGILTLPKFGGEVLDQQWSGGNSGGSTIGQERFMAQTFTPGSGFNLLGRIDLYLTYGLGEPVDITVEIRETDVNGNPTSKILGSGKINAFTQPAFPTYDWVSCVFQQPIQLNPSTKYAIVLNCKYSQTNNVYVWGYNFNYPSGGYTGGNRINSFDGGKTWQQAAWEDFLFKTYSPPTSYVLKATAQSLQYFISSTTYVSFKGCKLKTLLSQSTTVNIFFADSSDKTNWSDWNQDIKSCTKGYIKWKIELNT